MSTLHKKLKVRAIFRKTCNLRNFACYKFLLESLFSTLQEDWTTLQQFIIPWYDQYDKAIYKLSSDNKILSSLIKKVCRTRSFLNHFREAITAPCFNRIEFVVIPYYI